MEKLIITVTVDSTVSYPGNPYCPPTEAVDKVAREYVDSVKAGAAITHIHGVHRLEAEIQPDGRRLSRIDFDGWRRLSDAIRSATDAVMQFGIASARFEEKTRLMGLHPDMMAISFNPHDEFFQPDVHYPANEMYAIHPRDELVAYCRAAAEHHVKVEVETFQTGAFWNLEYVRRQGLMNEPAWCTLFLGWPGGCWTPPTPKSLLYMTDHLPARCRWNLSVMDPATQWDLLTLAVSMGGHVRVGWEDNPYLPSGEVARSNARLVDQIVQIAERLGRDVATPAEARAIMAAEPAASRWA